MPLLGKKPFERREVPPGVKPQEKIYYLEASNEIYTNYDDYFERMIQLNSTVWACEFTSKTGLTFFEAQESETEAMKALDDFPDYLEKAITFMVKHFTCRGRFDELLNDIASFVKDRYFINEVCTYMEDNKRLAARITDCSLIDAWEPTQSMSKEMQAPAPESYRYSLQLLEGLLPDGDELDDGCREGVPASVLCRSKQLVSKQKLRLFLKNACYLASDRYKIKDRYERDRQFDMLEWADVMGGPSPVFPQTPMLQRGRAPKTPATPGMNGTPTMHGTPSVSASSIEDDLSLNSPQHPRSSHRKPSEKKRMKIVKQQEELFHTFDMARRLGINTAEWEQTERWLSMNDIANLKDVIRNVKAQNRDANRDAQKQKTKAKIQWTKKRDDLECDDLKPLPSLPKLPLPDWIPEADFDEYLCILQFFNAFHDLLPTKEIRGTSRVLLSDVIRSIRCGDPQLSPYADLMRVLLSARTDRADEEDGDEADLTNKDEVALIKMQNCDPDHEVYGEEIREITHLHEIYRGVHGQSVRHLPVDWMTLTETLVMIIDTSGYYTGVSTHRHRLFQRGGYKGYKDEAFIFKKEHPEIVEKMRISTVFDLEPKERLLLMKMVINQLLSYAKFRNMQDERLNTIWEQRRELKKLRLWDQTQDQEAREARLAREYEIEQEQAGEKELSTKSQPSKETNKLRNYLKAVRDGKRTDKEQLENMLLTGVAYNELDLEEILTAKELQREKVRELENKLLQNIFDLEAISGHLYVGRDRAFRLYFLIEDIPAVLVENPTERDRLTQCQEATPVADDFEYGSEEAARAMTMGCSGNMATCTVHGAAAKTRPRWSYIDSIDTLDKIVAACNPRGNREIDLAEELTYYRPRLEEVINKMTTKVASGNWASIFLSEMEDPVEQKNSIDWEQEIIELLLDLEEKIAQGMLGGLPESIDRNEWRRQLYETGDITPLIDSDLYLTYTDDVLAMTKEEVKQLDSTKKLAVAFLQLMQSISLKFFSPPFTQTAVGEPRFRRLFLTWQKYLLEIQSMSALSLFLSTLEPAIQWDKSRLQGKCRLCRKKGAAELLVLCGECDKCFHYTCAKVSNPAPSDWCCWDCTTEKRKKKAVEKRKAAKEAAAAEYFDADREESPDENENSMDSGRSTPKSTTRTSSGRAVKKVEYKESAMTPPLKQLSKRNSSTARSNGLLSLDDYDYEDNTPTRVSSRKRPRNDNELNGFNHNASVSVSSTPSSGRRVEDAESKAKFQQLEALVKETMKQDFAWPFIEPVDAKEVPDYYEVISKPIDLMTMINKLKKKVYDSPEEMRSDCYLLVANCKKYNMEGSDIYDCANSMENYMETRMKDIFPKKKRR